MCRSLALKTLVGGPHRRPRGQSSDAPQTAIRDPSYFLAMASISARIPARLRAVTATGLLHAAAERAPVKIVAARFRGHATGRSVLRLVPTAVFAYLLARLMPGSTQPVLAPLTAVLVAQATLFQTVHNAVKRVIAVVAGVLLALILATAVGFTWWTLGLTIGLALVIGSVLNLGDHLLEVPISAMLILSLDTQSAATGRVVDTIVGAVAGLAGGLLLSRARTQPAEQAIGEFSRQLAGLLQEIAAGVISGSGPRETEAWLARARALTGEIQQVEDTLGEAEESLRLKPRALRPARTAVPLRNGLETLEHAAVTTRGLARSITEGAHLPDGELTALAPDSEDMLAKVLWRLAAAVRAYGGHIRADCGARADSDELEYQLATAREQQDRLAQVLRQAPEPAPRSWQLRGEILVHLDRLAGGLRAEELGRVRGDAECASWRQTVRSAWSRQAA